MAFALVANVAAGSSDGGNNVTTGGVDTTGATLLIVGVASYDGSGTPVAITVSDSKGNTWTPLTRTTFLSGAVIVCQFFYCAVPTVGAGHTFSVSSTGAFPTLAAAAFTGNTGTPFDQENGGRASGVTSLQPGSVTPTEDDELLVTIVGSNTTNTLSLDGGFTETDEVAYSGGNHFGASMAYLIQASLAAANPTWSWSNSTGAAAAIATFKAAAGTPTDSSGIHAKAAPLQQVIQGGGLW